MKKIIVLFLAILFLATLTKNNIEAFQRPCNQNKEQITNKSRIDAIKHGYKINRETNIGVIDKPLPIENVIALNKSYLSEVKILNDKIGDGNRYWYVHMVPDFYDKGPSDEIVMIYTSCGELVYIMGYR